jgi:transcriptional regulator with XRE-family HTH domain
MKAIYCPGYRALVARLRGARLNAGLTQSEVAARMGRCRTWVAKIESCELECGILDLMGFCRVYGLDVRDVIGSMEGR